jgi:hypothetical protein
LAGLVTSPGACRRSHGNSPGANGPKIQRAIELMTAVSFYSKKLSRNLHIRVVQFGSNRELLY